LVKRISPNLFIMKICLVGSILRHTIESESGTYSGWGGMTESAVAPFAALLDSKSSRINFVGSVGEEDIKEVKDFYNKNYPLVDHEGIFVNSAGTDHHHGNKHFVKRRVQLKPTTYEHIKPYIRDADIVIFNFGNIDDIDPGAIRKVKENSRALVYVDVHRKPFGADENGFMYVRGWKGWERYLKYADVVQMDRNECEALFGKKIKTFGQVAGYAKRILGTGAGKVLITLGALGGLFAYRESDKQKFVRFSNMKCNVLDTTGCGDAFAAGYLVSWHDNNDFAGALKWGTLMAAVNCEFVGYMRDVNKKNIAQRLPASFPLVEIKPGDRTPIVTAH